VVVLPTDARSSWLQEDSALPLAFGLYWHEQSCLSSAHAVQILFFSALYMLVTSAIASAEL
jgi:hypothetical protein